MSSKQIKLLFVFLMFSSVTGCQSSNSLFGSNDSSKYNEHQLEMARVRIAQLEQKLARAEDDLARTYETQAKPSPNRLINQDSEPKFIPAKIREIPAKLNRHLEPDSSTGSLRWRSTIPFKNGEIDLANNSKRELVELAKILNDPTIQSMNITIVGHANDSSSQSSPTTDDRFPSDWHLSAARAVTVQQFLLASGINANRMGVSSYAETDPSQTGVSSVNGLTKSRSVEIYLSEPTTPLVGRAINRNSTLR